jgi:hypothetical protein
MITSWTNEEDKANAKYDSIRGKSKHNTGSNNNNNNNNNNNKKGVVATTTTRVLTASVSQTTQSWLYNALRKTTRKNLWRLQRLAQKRSVRGIWRVTTLPSSATNSGKNSKIHQILGLLTTRRARRKSAKATTTSRYPKKR